MAGTLTWSLARSMDGTAVDMPAVSAQITGVSECFVYEETITNGGGEVEIDLASIAAAQAKLVIVTSDNYAPGDNTLVYKFNDTGETPQNFVGPIIFSESVVAHLGVAPDKVLITNTLASTADANIRVELYYDPTT